MFMEYLSVIAWSMHLLRPWLCWSTESMHSSVIGWITAAKNGEVGEAHALIMWALLEEA